MLTHLHTTLASISTTIASIDDTSVTGVIPPSKALLYAIGGGLLFFVIFCIIRTKKLHKAPFSSKEATASVPVELYLFSYDSKKGGAPLQTITLSPLDRVIIGRKDADMDDEGKASDSLLSRWLFNTGTKAENLNGDYRKIDIRGFAGVNMENVSRQNLSFIYEDGQLTLFDGGPGRPSKNGVTRNGCFVSDGGDLVFANDIIAFGFKDRKPTFLLEVKKGPRRNTTERRPWVDTQGQPDGGTKSDTTGSESSGTKEYVHTVSNIDPRTTSIL